MRVSNMLKKDNSTALEDLAEQASCKVGNQETTPGLGQ